MNINLRERRRRQTADDIQQAALRLALSLGYDSVTTEAVAAEAGISARTFFNYYPNKQAAILGSPPRIDECCPDWVVTSQAPLLDDLVALMSGVFGEGHRLDRAKIRMIRDVLAASPELEPLFHGMLETNTRILIGLLQERLGAERTVEAELIARLATGALSHAVRDWACHDTMPQSRIASLLRQRLEECCRLLCP